MQYLRYRTVRQVVLPVMEPQHWEILQPFLEERRIQWTLFTARMQTADFQIPGGTVIRPYFTRHIDKAFWTVPHSCYVISVGEKHALLTADVDYTIETFEQISRVHMNAAFVNPLFFNGGLSLIVSKQHEKAATPCVPAMMSLPDFIFG